VTISAKVSRKPNFQFPLETEIKSILAARVDERRQAAGIVIGTIRGGKRNIIGYGRFSLTDARQPGGDTLFEIGSVTKVFTALVLTTMVRRGEVGLDEPVKDLLPSNVRIPCRAGQTIRLQDLATHTSGLPRMPGNFTVGESKDPYSSYTVDDLYNALSTQELPRDIGSKYEYSNLGMGLLGHALACRAGTAYETLVSDRILCPLGLTSTAIVLSDDMNARFTSGHDFELNTVDSWHLDESLAAAGALRSTADDQLTFLDAMLRPEKCRLTDAAADMLAVRRPTEILGIESGLGWLIDGRNGDDLVWHSGATAGYSSFVGFSREEAAGVVVLSNTANDISDIGRHLLNANAPLSPAPKFRAQIAIDQLRLHAYTGCYQLLPGVLAKVTTRNGRLFAQVTGEGNVEIYPESERAFFAKVVDAQVIFEANGDNVATSLTLHLNGQTFPGSRIND